MLSFTPDAQNAMFPLLVDDDGMDTTMAILSVAEHPVAVSSPSTVYVVVAETAHCTVSSVVELRPSGGDQVNPVAPVAMNVVFAVPQNGPAGSAEAFTNGSA